ncbi:hypothetical protein K445DRAFT_153691 [Daldinia sp. EC12]|nr:hypothetical protein K445DRAFT_153691 [Daldinia sp. EC12]
MWKYNGFRGIYISLGLFSISCFFDSRQTPPILLRYRRYGLPADQLLKTQFSYEIGSPHRKQTYPRVSVKIFVSQRNINRYIFPISQLGRTDILHSYESLCRD